jgi:L-serine kinase (ADP)
MQIIILAAGSGRRMGELTSNTHKSLLKIDDHDSFLSKLLHQLNEYEISKIVVVTGFCSQDIANTVSQFQQNFEIIYNDRYKEDTNIYSLKLALDKLSPFENTIIIEADTIIDDLALKDIYFSSTQDKSIWFTRGKFTSTQYGGILNSSNDNNVNDIRIVKEYSEAYKNYHKLLGVTTIGKNEFKTYYSLVKEYVEKTIKQYYLIPWIENLKLLPCEMFDLEEDYVTSINTGEEYNQYIKASNKRKPLILEYELLNIKKIHPIENYIEKRKDLIFNKIKNDGYWIKPIIIDKSDFLIMDGHHRFEAAKELGFRNIPVIKIDYDLIPIWSLRKSEIVTKELVKEKALKGDIYPNKTVKHSFPFEVANCKIPLKELLQ